MKTLLVATDFGEPALRAEQLARELALAGNASLHLLHVVEPIGTREDLDAEDKAFLNALEEKARSQMEERQKALSDVPVRCTVVLGHRSEVISRMAHELDAWMVVMGTHAGHEEGVSRQVTYRIERPVLLVP